MLFYSDLAVYQQLLSIRNGVKQGCLLTPTLLGSSLLCSWSTGLGQRKSVFVRDQMAGVLTLPGLTKQQLQHNKNAGHCWTTNQQLEHHPWLQTWFHSSFNLTSCVDHYWKPLSEINKMTEYPATSLFCLTTWVWNSPKLMVKTKRSLYQTFVISLLL